MDTGQRLEGYEQRTLPISGMTVSLAVEQDVPAAARQLIWKEFFSSRDRGIDWATHFPWADAGVGMCASARIGESVVATLLIRLVPDTATAMIGCVCVDPTFRGRGLSRQLIDLAAMPLRRLRIGRMLLWTGKPGVYERSGFVAVAQERRLTLRGRPGRHGAAITLSSWPADEAMIGLPPFATAGWQATSTATRLVFVDTPMGAALLDHAGDCEDVLRMMFGVRPGDWSATLDAGHPLRHHAIAQGVCVEDVPGPVTMVRPLDDNTVAPARVPPAFRI